MMVINSTSAIKHPQRASERRDGRSRDVAELMRINLGVMSDVACELSDRCEHDRIRQCIATASCRVALYAGKSVSNELLATKETGPFNLMRNIGASIGISLMRYLLVRNSTTT